MANGNIQQVGNVLAGLSAGLQGRLPEFQAQQTAQREQKRRADLERQKTVFTDSLAALNFANQGRFDLVQQLGQRRLAASQNFPNVDFSQTEQLTTIAGFAAQGDQEAQQNLLNTLRNNVDIGRGLGVLEAPSEREAAELENIRARTAKLQREAQAGPKKQIGTASQRDFSTFLDLKDQAAETGNQEDINKATQFGRQAGFIRESLQEKADIKVSEIERRETAKFNVKRKQGFIDSGIDSADSAANLRRGITLLDNVKTGGFDNLQFRAKQIFGIEGADELELSTAMGKSVLAQLRPIFGSAFTAKEGESLKRIEARFGASTAGNKRLMGRALKIVERSARRGIAAAEDQGDIFTADEIRSSLEFTLTPTDESAASGSNAVGRFQVEVIN